MMQVPTISTLLTPTEGLPGAAVVKNPPANEGVPRDASLTPGSGRSGGGRGNPLQYSCLENPMDRGVRRATVYGVSENRKLLSRHARKPNRQFSALLLIDFNQSSPLAAPEVLPGHYALLSPSVQVSFARLLFFNIGRFGGPHSSDTFCLHLHS